MRSVLLVGLGGALGAVCRYLIGRIPVHAPFPILTLLINVTGGAPHRAPSPGLCCGGTGCRRLPSYSGRPEYAADLPRFRRFSLESLDLLESGKSGWGALYILLSIGLCLGGVTLGRALVRLLVKTA